jgi:hypothetical protein
MCVGRVVSIRKQCLQHGAVAVILSNLYYGRAIQSHAALTEQQMQEVVGHTRIVGGIQSFPIGRHQLSGDEDVSGSI